MDIQEPLTKKECKELKRQERLGAEEKSERKRRWKKIASWSLGSGIIIALIGSLIWYVATKPPIPESDIISRSGLHWHPELAIYINGKRENIPANIGIGITHNPVHTHDPDNVIHLEFSGLVRKEDIRLAQFFDVWGKTFNREQILSNRNGPDGNVTMLVNGGPNDQFENYVMQDKDKIEIKYEK